MRKEWKISRPVSLLLLILFFMVPGAAFAANLVDYSTFDGTYALQSNDSLMYGNGGSYSWGGASISLSTPVEHIRIKYASGACPAANHLFLWGAGGTVMARGDFFEIGGPTDIGSVCDYSVSTNHGYTNFKGITVNQNGASNGDSLAALNTSDFDIGNGNVGSLYSAGKTFAFQLCDSGGCSGGFTTPSFYYAKVKSTDDYRTMRSGPGTSYSVLKTLPNDWIVYVGSTTSSGSPVIANGYAWYQITDPTDGSGGWMAGSDASTTSFYLPYDMPHQTVWQASSSDTIGTLDRPTAIMSIVNHYYNDSSTTPSLYSSDDSSSNSYKISLLKNNSYPEVVILGLLAQESGGVDFDNEYVRKDYGHGIGQITFVPGSWDNRGKGSQVNIPPCSVITSTPYGISSTAYEDCYTDPTSDVTHYYQHYSNNSLNPIYKQYTNTSQSMYANIKDALVILAHAYSLVDDISSSVTAGDSVTYSAFDRKVILGTEYYNGSNQFNNDACTNLNGVATRLDTIGSYFTNATSSAVSDLVEKMHSASQHTVCAQLESPGELSISDAEGRVVGVTNGKGKNDFPLAIYDAEKKYVKVYAASDQDSYTYNVVGTAKGTYGLKISAINNGKEVQFEAKNIPILPNGIHTYKINIKDLVAGKDGVTLRIDRNGTGKVDRTIISRSTINGDSLKSDATPDELEAFAIGDPPDAPKNTKETHITESPAQTQHKVPSVPIKPSSTVFGTDINIKI